MNKKHRFNPKTLHQFDEVIVRDDSEHNWKRDIFSCIQIEWGIFKYWTLSSCFKYCIPYNEDTKHLVGTKEEAPEYYRYWEE